MYRDRNANGDVIVQVPHPRIKGKFIYTGQIAILSNVVSVDRLLCLVRGIYSSVFNARDMYRQRGSGRWTMTGEVLTLNKSP